MFFSVKYKYISILILQKYKIHQMSNKLLCVTRIHLSPMNYFINVTCV